MSKAAKVYSLKDMALPASGTVFSEWHAIMDRHLSIRASWSATPVGVFVLQCSFDGVTADDVPGAAAEFTANSQAQPAGSASKGIWNFLNVPGGVWRLFYTGSSGASTGVIRYAWSS
jgi:hypothetical protein